MKPRRVVIVRGSLEDSAALAEACNSIVASDAGPDFQSDPQANNKRVFTPRTGEVVDATTGLVTNTRFLDIFEASEGICRIIEF